MIVTFDKEYLKELYITGKCSDKKHRFQPDVIKRYARCIYRLEEASREEDLYKISSLNYEVLRGDKEGISSIRVTGKYRIEFTISLNPDIDEFFVRVCNILELSNHYK